MKLRLNRRALRLLAAATPLVLAACGAGHDGAEQKSAARIARAVEVVRGAPNLAKGQALDGLSNAECTGQEVCATRDLCASAYRLHVEGVTLTEAAKLQLSEGKAEDAAKLLGSAQLKLQEAERKVSACTDCEAALRRQYKL